MDEKYISMSEAARLTPRRPSAGTIWRWARRGIRARDGQCVRLHHVRVGGRVYTTETWLAQFFEQVAAVDLGNPRWRSPNRSSLPHEVATARLVKEGM